MPSFAGNGLAERMRSTAFAIFGLTAAGGLVLVALFSQTHWLNLDTGGVGTVPAATSIAAAHGLGADPAHAPPLTVHRPVRSTAAHAAGPAERGAGTHSDGQPSAPAVAASPEAVAVVAPSGGRGSDGATKRSHDSAPAPVSQSPAGNAPQSTPVSEPAAASPPPEEATASSAAAPGRSGEAGSGSSAPGKSGSAPGHAGSGPGNSGSAPARTAASGAPNSAPAATTTASAATTAAAPAPTAPTPGNGNGHAYGLAK